jgi:hypothetical protein
MKKLLAGAGLMLPLLATGVAQAAPSFPDQTKLCTSLNTTLEAQRAASAASFPTPVATKLLVNGVVAWTTGSSAVPTVHPGDTLTLIGSGFGGGPNIDFSKIMIGNSRVLETGLTMYQQQLDLLSQVNYETASVKSTWPSDVVSWTDTQVVFTVPAHASKGPLKLQVQKRTGYNLSLTKPGQAHEVINAQTLRVTDTSVPQTCDVVSQLSTDTKAIVPINVTVSNSAFSNMLTLGRQIFWSYDFNLGLSHKLRNLDWAAILSYKTTDPITRQAADPNKLFGAYKTVAGEVPTEAMNDVAFNPYPQTNPTPGFLLLTPQLTSGNTTNTGWAGWRNAQSSSPTAGSGSWAGFNCASCHGYRLSYEKSPGNTITKVVPGLPNPNWTMKWTVLGTNTGATTATFQGISGFENGPGWASGSAPIDKTTLLYYMPAGAGEHTMVRNNGEGSLTDNDYQFSPIAIPSVTNYLPIRRSLSHTESYVGFEGSYIHSEEPDGAMGSMDTNNLKALTAYMSTLDQDDPDLVNAGLYRWLKANGKLAAQTGNAALTEGQFVQAGWQAYPGVVSAVGAGQTAFNRDCGSCHTDKLGANSNERMIPLNQVGRFFAPTIYQRQQQAIRVGFLHDLYWVQSRGLLSDGHVRNLEDLVNPDRCTQGSALYNQYYTLHTAARPAPGSLDQPTPTPDYNRKGDVFRVPVTASTLPLDTGWQRNLFIERHKYFTKPAFDTANYYWDYQKMRANYGPDEMGTAAPIGMPAAPHPWCAASAGDIAGEVEYSLTR